MQFKVEEGAGKVLPIRGTGLILERAGRQLLAGVDIDIAGSRTLAIVGPNGAGKSVLVRTLAGLIPPTAGEVTWAQLPPDRRRAAALGLVFQRPVHLRRSALANVEYALAIAGVPATQRKQRAEAALARAGIVHLAASPARVLSGGEQQLLAIARALATAPEVLILDEPTSNLGPAATAAIEGLIGKVRADGTCVVLVTHDLAQVRRVAEEVTFLHHGRIIERTPAAEFLSAPQSMEGRAYVRGEIVL